MNVLKKIKKVAAVAAGTVMLSSTIGAAAASDLGDFPAPFVNDDGVFSGKLVIGENAATADVIGAVDIATALQAAAGSDATTSGSVSISGGELQDISLSVALGHADAFGATLDDVDLPGSLREYALSIDNDANDIDEQYDVHEEITLSTNAVFALSTALTMAADDSLGIATDDSEEFGDKVFLPAPAGAMKYCIEFDETLDVGGYFNDTSDDDPIFLEFLGRDLEVTGATATSLDVKVGQSFLLDAGDSVVVDGKTVTLVRTSASAAVIEVNGETKVIDETEEEEVNGVNIQVDAVYDDDGIEYDSAEILVGEETEETYDDEEAFIGEDEDDPAWTWELSGLNSDDPTICVEWELDIDRPDEDDNPMYERPLYEGESYTFPFDFASVTFDSLTVTDSGKYTLETTSEDLENAAGTATLLADKEVLKMGVSGLSDQGFLVNGTKSEAVYLYDAGTIMMVFRKERDGSGVLWSHNVTHTPGGFADLLVDVDYKKSTADVKALFNGSTDIGNLSIEFSSADMLRFEIKSVSGEFTYLGSGTEDTGSTNDVMWYDGSTHYDISTREADARTVTGVVIEDPDAGVSSDEFVFHVPADIDDYKGNVIVSGSGTSVTRTAGASAVMVNPIAVGMAVSDGSAMGMLGRENLLVVGGPCANSVAASLLGSPAECAEGFEMGYGRIQWFDSQKALLVAGYSAEDTTKAARVLAEYEANADDFMGKSEVRVITSTGSITGVE